MNSKERQLIFDIAGGDSANFPAIHQIHSGYRRGIQMLEWLKLHGIVGKSFKQFAMDNGFSKLRMGSYILKRLESTNKRPIFAKDLT